MKGSLTAFLFQEIFLPKVKHFFVHLINVGNKPLYTYLFFCEFISPLSLTSQRVFFN